MSEIFTSFGLRDPFLDGRFSPYLEALAKLPFEQRRVIARQAAILATVVGVDLMDALTVVGQVAIWLCLRNTREGKVNRWSR